MVKFKNSPEDGRRSHGERLSHLLTGKWASRTALILAVALWAGMIFFFIRNRDSFTVDNIISGSPKSRGLAVLTMLLLFAVKSVSIVLYSGILYITSGLLFPLPLAILVNILGTMVMLTIPYLLGRLMGRNALRHIEEKYPRASAISDFQHSSDFMFSFIIHIINLLPTDLVSIYMGASELKYIPYLSGGVLGLLVTCVLFPITGMSITRPSSPEFIISVALEIFVTVVSVAAYGIIKKRKRAREEQESKNEERDK